jgi:hypothetical protein
MTVFDLLMFDNWYAHKILFENNPIFEKCSELE